MLFRALNPSTPSLKVSQVVAFDYVVPESSAWQWTLGTIRELHEHTATLQMWAIHSGDLDTLRTILNREVDAETVRMKDYNRMLQEAREALAKIRRANEDSVTTIRTEYEAARGCVEEFDEVDLRKLTSQTTPSPVAMAVLKAALAVARCDPSVDEYYSWTDIQLEYRKSHTLTEFTNVDALAKIYPSHDTIRDNLEKDPRLSVAAAKRDSNLVACLHQWVTSALAYQQAYANLTQDKRIQEQNDAIAAAIAGMKAARAKIMKLKEELAAKNSSALPGQVTSFTKTSAKITVPLSAVIRPVPVDGHAEGCALTDDEVSSIVADATELRFQLKSKVHSIGDRFLSAYSELSAVTLYATELEERFHLLEHLSYNTARDMAALCASNHDATTALARQLEETQEQVRELELENDALTAELQDATAQASQHAAGLEGQKRIVDALRAELDERDDVNERLQGELESKDRDVADQEQALKAADAENAQLAKELEDALAELAAHREKRRAALDARAADPELAAADAPRGVPRAAGSRASAGRGVPRGGSPAGSGARAVPGTGADAAATTAVDPDTIRNEPVLCVSLAELGALRGELDEKRCAIVEYLGELEEALDSLEEARREADGAATRAADAEVAHDRSTTDLLAKAEALAAQLASVEDHYGNELTDARRELDRLLAQNESMEALLDSLKTDAAATEQKLCAENAQLAKELEDALAELAAHREKRRAALDARAADPELAAADAPRGGLRADCATDAAATTAVDPDTIRNEPLLAVMLDELQALRANLSSQTADAELAARELSVAQRQLADKDAELKALQFHDERWPDPDGTKGKVTHRFTKIFDGNWKSLIQHRPEALHAAFVIDSSNACHVPGDQIGKVLFDHD